MHRSFGPQDTMVGCGVWGVGAYMGRWVWARLRMHVIESFIGVLYMLARYMLRISKFICHVHRFNCLPTRLAAVTHVAMTSTGRLF